MIEFIKHLFGFCGEGHVNIFHVLAMGSVPFVYSVYKAQYYITLIKNFIKK